MKDETTSTKTEQRNLHSPVLHHSSFSLHPSSFFLHPSSFMTLAWTLALAGAVALWDAGERWMAVQADQPVILLPERAPDDAQRQTTARRIADEAGVSSVLWRSPAELNRRVRGALPEPGWTNLLPQDEAWAPWVLEVHLQDPLDHADAARALVARHEQEGGWQLVLWDAAALDTLAGQRLLWRGGLGIWAVLVALGGALALALAPSQASPRAAGRLAVWCWTTVLSLAAVVAVWAMIPILGGPADARSLTLALTVAFLLAGILAPVLSVRSQKTVEPPRSSVAISIQEASDERPNPRPGE
jgi:hypothetical protein